MNLFDLILNEMNEASDMEEAKQYATQQQCINDYVNNPRFKHLDISTRKAMGASAYAKQNKSNSQVKPYDPEKYKGYHWNQEKDLEEYTNSSQDSLKEADSEKKKTYSKSEKNNNSDKGSQRDDVKSALRRYRQEFPGLSDEEAIVAHAYQQDKENAAQQKEIDSLEKAKDELYKKIDRTNRDLTDKEKRFKDQEERFQAFNREVAKMGLDPVQAAHAATDYAKGNKNPDLNRIKQMPTIATAKTTAKAATAASVPTSSSGWIASPAMRNGTDIDNVGSQSDKVKKQSPTGKDVPQSASASPFGQIAQSLKDLPSTAYLGSPKNQTTAPSIGATEPINAPNIPTPVASATPKYIPGIDEFDPDSIIQIPDLNLTAGELLGKESAMTESINEDLGPASFSPYKEDDINQGRANVTELSRAWLNPAQQRVTWQFGPNKSLTLQRNYIFGVMSLIAIMKSTGESPDKIYQIFSNKENTLAWLHQPVVQKYVNYYPTYEQQRKEKEEEELKNSPQMPLPLDQKEPVQPDLFEQLMKQLDSQINEISRADKFRQHLANLEKSRLEFLKSIAHLPFKERQEAMRRYIEKNLNDKEVDEASMSWAAHKPTGPKFGGYLKGTDPAPTEFSKKSVGGCEESTTLPENFITWAMEQKQYKNFDKNPAVYNAARLKYKKLQEAADVSSHTLGSSLIKRPRTNPIKIKKPKQIAVAESLRDYEREQWIVTLDSGKKIKFTCDADCDVESYIENKYKEPVANIKYIGIVGEPPAEPEDYEKNEGVAEGHADQQRKVFKKNGKPVGEVGIDRESSPGVGQYYMKHYASGKDLSGYDSYEEAVAELKHCLKQGVVEGSTTRGGFGGSASQAHHEIQWLKNKIETLKPLLAKKPSVARQIKDLERQIRERELAIVYQKEGVAEDLDANQKRVGQLGPTEPVGKNEKNLRGKLVGAESVDPEIRRLKKLSGV